MKKIISITLVLLVPVLLFAQNPAVDKLFNKYQGQEGFTTVMINKEIFKLISSTEKHEEELDKPLDKITGIKILAQEDEAVMEGLNFYDELKKDLDFSAYVELVVVKEKDQDVWIIARENNGRMAELLVIVGGDDNALIWIQGDFTFEELAQLGDIDGLEHLNLLDHD
ncbi:MAG: hypothetical protein AMS27_17555 [Bacteroides sp. SM23_62_1]|nr:MAG: hypothetical protein AMS27_17555 [Bacteroides sp. SM23_62_1]